MALYSVTWAWYSVKDVGGPLGQGVRPTVTVRNTDRDDGASGRPTLGEETRAVVRARIVQGAVAALAATGFDVTVDEIASTAGVSRRTVFRHFATHDEVLAAAVAEILASYDRLLPGPPAPGTNVEAWLTETAVTLHELNTRLMGKAFWDMNVERPGISPSERDRRRTGYATQIAQNAWRLANGKGRPPSWVVDAFALQLSGFATNCLDGYSTERAGRVSARILKTVLAAALAEEQGQLPD
jgi:AcrR family transcriptional regulator